MRSRGTPPPRSASNALHHAAWVARCVGHGSLAPLGPDDLHTLSVFLTPVTFERGDVLFRSGRPSEAVWIVQHGRVALFSGSGNDRIIISVLRPGDVDGDLPLLLGMSTPYDAEAMEQVECLRLDAASFDLLLEHRPAVARRWLNSVAGRLSASQQRLAELLGLSLPEQIARVLLDEAQDGEVAFSQATIAALLGARRQSVNKVLRDFGRRGAVDVGYRSISILDRSVLTAVSGRSAAPG